MVEVYLKKGNVELCMSANVYKGIITLLVHSTKWSVKRPINEISAQTNNYWFPIFIENYK